MMDALLNHARRAASEEGAERARTRHGTVDGYDPENHAVRVLLEPEGTLTGWIPLKSAWVGNGWGLFLAPSVGDAIEIDFQESDGGVGSAGWRFFNDSERPLSVPSGEAWFVHKSGSFLKLLNNGAIATNAKLFAHTGEMSVSGSLTVDGNVSAGSGASGTFTDKTGLTITVQDGIITNIY